MEGLCLTVTSWCLSALKATTTKRERTKKCLPFLLSALFVQYLVILILLLRGD